MLSKLEGRILTQRKVTLSLGMIFKTLVIYSIGDEKSTLPTGEISQDSSVLFPVKDTALSIANLLAQEKWDICGFAQLRDYILKQDYANMNAVSEFLTPFFLDCNLHLDDVEPIQCCRCAN